MTAIAKKTRIETINKLIYRFFKFHILNAFVPKNYLKNL